MGLLFFRKIEIKLRIISTFLLLYSSVIFSQNETDNWYFGENAGINFSNGVTTVLNNSQMNTPAGCSSISDYDGNLLFYTNGQTVWNRNHQIMTNGTNLAGEIENLQSAIIVPKPNNTDVYYIFTTRENANTTVSPNQSPGLYYSEVRFDAQNPDGFVAQKNYRLTNYIKSRLSAIYHYESNSYRVIALGTENGLEGPVIKTFYIYNVTNNGVQLYPTTITQSKPMPSYGQMKISPNGKLLAVVDYEERYIHLYDFDNDNVSLSFKKSINPDFFGVEVSPTGVEFSQDSKVIYFTSKLNANNNNYLLQYDLDPPGGIFDKLIVFKTDQYQLRSLQLSINGKIYMSQLRDRDTILYGHQHIGVINDPEKIGLDCNFQESILDLQTGKSLKGLPIFVASSLRNRIITENRCVNETFDFTTDTYAPITSIQWDFGDGNTSNTTDPSHNFSMPGNYLVKAFLSLNGITTTLYKRIIVHPLPVLETNTTMQQCDPENDGIAYFNLNNVREKILNQDYDYNFTFHNSLSDAENGVNEIQNPEFYENNANPEQIFVRIINDANCASIDSFFIEAVHNTIGHIDNFYTCENSDGITENNEGVFNLDFKKQEIISQLNLPASSILSFYDNYEDALAKTNALNGDFISPSRALWLRIDDENYDCNGIKSFNLTVNPPINLDKEVNYYICGNENQITLDGGATNDTWVWKQYTTGEILSTNQEFTTSQPGVYSVTVTKTENEIQCSLSKTFVIQNSGTIELKKITADNQEIYVFVAGISSYQFSLDNVNFFGNGHTYTFTNLESGHYTVYIRDINNCESPIQRDIVLMGHYLYFTPNNDGYNDTWKFSNMNSYFNDIDVTIFNRYGKLLKRMNKLELENEGWDGNYNGNQLPSSDYWFKAVLTDSENKVFELRGSFTLKR